MFSRDPGYGHLDYLKLDIIVDIITLNLIELGLMLILVYLGFELEEPSQILVQLGSSK